MMDGCLAEKLWAWMCYECVGMCVGVCVCVGEGVCGCVGVAGRGCGRPWVWWAVGVCCGSGGVFSLLICDCGLCLLFVDITLM